MIFTRSSWFEGFSTFSGFVFPFPGHFFLDARAAGCYLLSNSRDCSII